MNHLLRRRWVIALAGMTLQLCLGTVYAWSFFQGMLKQDYGWNDSQATWPFSLAICFLGLAAAGGGILLPRLGPRVLAVAGGVLFGAGYLLGGLALHWKSLGLFYLGYGVVGGVGLGLGYVTPVATVAKWFPDKKGLATGMVIMGFGLGALLMSKLIAPGLCKLYDNSLPLVFAWMGVVFLGASVTAAWLLKNPPDGFEAALRGELGLAAAPAATFKGAQPDAAGADALQFAAMWLIFFCNIWVGISIIGFQSPLIQKLFQTRDAALDAKSLAASGATLIAVSSLFNGAGRMFWGGLSDRIGRVQAFRLMLGVQIAIFVALAKVGNPWIFGGLVCCVLLCYGGGFGTMPSLVLDTFGPRRMAVLYGLILTAWSAAGVAGPQFLAILRDRGAEPLVAFLSSAGVLCVGLVATAGLKQRA